MGEATDIFLVNARSDPVEIDRVDVRGVEPWRRSGVCDHETGARRVEHGSKTLVRQAGRDRHPDGIELGDRDLGDECVERALEEDRDPVARPDLAAVQKARQAVRRHIEVVVGERPLCRLEGATPRATKPAELVAAALHHPHEPLIRRRARFVRTEVVAARRVERACGAGGRHRGAHEMGGAFGPVACVIGPGHVRSTDRDAEGWTGRGTRALRRECETVQWSR
ncbi:hypothetical protein PGB27_12515 [Actinomycetospora sp. DW7H6]|uniref:Uncharacterized protein n=1 Tax=Actinomycetospora lemnae TaxID=3019891 RepID=A0ABT5STI8_9PSEU|nr:hypothetical protein [Actinomycetospora sp. DW7H6]MDD7966163.1 hypothetical protein [Actinomycetospora sp. DW7H6]